MLIKIEELLSFLERCAKDNIAPYREIMVPINTSDESKSNGRFFFSRLKGQKNYVIDGYRPVDPLKILFYNVREHVLPVNAPSEKRLIVGVKACDLKALNILDMALIKQDFVDPAYKIWRENTTIISSDCTALAPTCHCTLVDGKPFSEQGFDLNLSRVDDSYYMVTGSEKGQALLELIKKHCAVQTAPAGIEASIEKNRAEIIKQLQSQNAELSRSKEYKLLRSGEMSPWKEESRECVGCGACTNICPTCYCLILNDETQAQQFVKVRSYDSCQWHGYARVAGGASPRPHMFDRFRNRYLCKFMFMNSNFNVVGCTGCGRCTDACPGKIDFRAVVHNILEKPAAKSGQATG